MQHGRFTTSSVASRALATQVGCVIIVDGSRLNAMSEEISKDEHLIYILIVCPEIEQHGSSVNDDLGTYVSTFDRTWVSSDGSIEVSIKWDRRTDIIIAGKQTFDREKGNVFVVRAEARKPISIQQLTDLGPTADFQQLLEHVQRQLPNEQILKSLKLDNN